MHFIMSWVLTVGFVSQKVNWHEQLALQSVGLQLVGQLAMSLVATISVSLFSFFLFPSPHLFSSLSSTFLKEGELMDFSSSTTLQVVSECWVYLLNTSPRGPEYPYLRQCLNNWLLLYESYHLCEHWYQYLKSYCVSVCLSVCLCVRNQVAKLADISGVSSRILMM